jgi:hypothetical protein
MLYSLWHLVALRSLQTPTAFDALPLHITTLNPKPALLKRVKSQFRSRELKAFATAAAILASLSDYE